MPSAFRRIECPGFPESGRIGPNQRSVSLVHPVRVTLTAKPTACPEDDNRSCTIWPARSAKTTGWTRASSSIAALRGRGDRKTYQLCRQVSDTLNFVLSGDTGDDVLRGLYVDRVDPAPDASRLLVSVAPLDRNDDTPMEVYLTKLMAISGKLRSEVAASISRRKTPELTYRVVPPDEPSMDDEDSFDQESE